jgi:hypothetical protein
VATATSPRAANASLATRTISQPRHAKPLPLDSQPPRVLCLPAPGALGLVMNQPNTQARTTNVHWQYIKAIWPRIRPPVEV